MDFGFTNDEKKYNAVSNFRDAAIADGWEASATYKSEPIESACTLYRGRWTMLVLTRKSGPKWKYEAKVSAWGPDRLSVALPDSYPGMEELERLLTHCLICGKNGVKTQRLSFAGRCCEECLLVARKEHEYPGWDN